MYHYLIGIGTKKIECNNQPTLRQLLQNFLYYHVEQRKPKTESAQLVVKNALPLWNKLRYEIRRADKIQSSLITQYEEYLRISKNKVSATSEQRQNRFDFEQKLDRVSDVAKAAPTRHTMVRRAVSDANRQIDETSIVQSRLRSRASLPSLRPSTSASTDQLKRKHVFFMIISSAIIQRIYQI